MTLQIKKISIQFSIHATESVKKNFQALKAFIPNNILENAMEYRTTLEGGYGNPIEYIEIIINNRKDIDTVINNLAHSLSEEERRKLWFEFNERFDQKSKEFFLRIDKSHALNNVLTLTDSSYSFRIAIKIVSFDRDKNYERALEEANLIVPE